jgi:hypothetical protein
LIIRALSYAGGGSVAGASVLVTSGSVSVEHHPGIMEPMYLPASGPRVQNVYSTGTMVTTGSIGFDLTYGSAGILSGGALFSRAYKFSVSVGDGQDGFSVSDCLATSVSVSGSAGGLVTASVSFISKNDASGGGSGGGVRDPVGYWASGGGDVKDWSLSFSQQVEPIYLNSAEVWPRGMRIGLIEATLEVSTFSRNLKQDVIIATSGVTLTGYTASQGYSFNGAGDVGTYKHSFTTATPFGTPGVGIS